MSDAGADQSHFDFGENWLSYSRNVLQKDRIEEATRSTRELLGRNDLNGLSFFDVGCGSGLFSITALQLGAVRVVGIDINPRSVEAARYNAARFLPADAHVQFSVADILEESPSGTFDVVYSWGVLHHTGKMWKAIENAMKCVRPGGAFALAIYNRHWSSPAWVMIKRMYNVSPGWLRKILIAVFYPLIYAAKAILTGDFSLKTPRGMDFYHDVIDWVGGYPYEYASINEITAFCSERGFTLLKCRPTIFLLGNNEYVFTRADENLRE